VQATAREFENRALVFGLIFAVAFPLYALDKQNSAAALSNWLAGRLGASPDLVAHVVLAVAAALVAAAALLRTWASSVLLADVVYATELKTDSLVADGPYRHVRNPLYFANVLMAIGMGALMSRVGFVVAVLGMIVFCYRLIFREEAFFEADQRAQYEPYRRAVPRLLPALRPRIAAGGRRSSWSKGFKAEAWYWGLAVALVAFAATLSLKIFAVVLAASLALLWMSSLALRKRSQPEIGRRP
jgi:protein-S-isoprenylcysteine O-methyltransferase Ste14